MEADCGSRSRGAGIGFVGRRAKGGSVVVGCFDLFIQLSSIRSFTGV